MTTLNKITYLIDEAFKLICIFLITFIWCLYIKKELFSALVYSAILSILILFISHFVLTSKKEKRYKKNIEQKKLIKFITRLKLSSSEEIINFFSTIYCDYEKHSYYLKKNDEIIYIALKENLNEDDIFSICACHTTSKHLKIICLSFTKGAELTSKKIVPLKVSLLNIKEVYFSNSESASAFSPTLDLTDKKLYTFKLLFLSAFSSDKAKKYLLLSLILISSMLFTPYKLFYTICASLALIFALLAKLQIFNN